MNIQNMLRGQIWLYNSNPSIGDEISKIRPAIIVNNDEIGILGDFCLRQYQLDRMVGIIQD
jgi:mRNA-degrading endonuclease toxin of MazEF toxin-antitoxin module